MSMPEKIRFLPSTPGVYLFKNNTGDVLYVGKAKVLRSRVQSYFRSGANLDPAKQEMVPRIADIETIATDNETEALILEANLIRQHQPPYNVVLRDDKYYLFIKITVNERLPRVFPVRRIRKDGARYFGPYSSARSVRHTRRAKRRTVVRSGGLTFVTTTARAPHLKELLERLPESVRSIGG
jgi:excinuclease ABC subunit C